MIPLQDRKCRIRFLLAFVKGGNADPAIDAIQDGDYHDLLDQNVGPEGF